MADIEKLAALGVDMVQVEKRFMGNHEFYLKCISIYFHTNDIARLEELCAEKNWQDAFKCVHALKGSAGNMGFMRLYEIYSRMTEFFRGGEPEKALELLPAAVEQEKALREAVE